MSSLGKLACLVAIYGSGAAENAAASTGADIVSAGARLTPRSTIQERAELRGLRVREVRWDPVLRQNWAVLEDVVHPERPLWAELTDAIAPLLDTSSAPTRGDVQPGASVAIVSLPPKPAVAIIHYGDRVRLWRIERNVRIEMDAVAESYAAVGEEVKLRLPGSGTESDAGWRVTGIARGPGNVEMEP